MPWKVEKSSDCPASKPFAVIKSDSGEKVACHATREGAEAQVRALYVNEKKTTADSNSNSDTDSPKNKTMSAKELHDRWLEQKVEGAKHPDDCPFCQEVEEPTGGTGDSMSDKTYTSEELAAAVALAVKPLEDKITELEAKDAEAETETKIAEAKAELETKISELSTALDVKVAEVEAAKKELEDLKTYLDAEKARVDEEAAREARKSERVEQVKENANYPDDYLNGQADRWAAMSDEEFAGLIDDLKAAGVKKADEEDDSLPADTKLTGASEKASKDGDTSVVRSLLEFQRAGVKLNRI